MTTIPNQFNAEFEERTVQVHMNFIAHDQPAVRKTLSCRQISLTLKRVLEFFHSDLKNGSRLAINYLNKVSNVYWVWRARLVERWNLPQQL